MIINKITKKINPRTVTATTYQMRNPFNQFYDGVASELDVHCYFQHAFAADLCPKNGYVLDVCCGRGLLIPFLRYRSKVSLYVGVDIHPQNAGWKDGDDPRRVAKTKKNDWGFPRIFIESNVANMVAGVRQKISDFFDLIVYTSSIEHMQKEDQEASLFQASLLSKINSILYLTFPVTSPGKNGYDTQYAAHVYEPKEIEVCKWLEKANWKIEHKIGLVTKTSIFREVLKNKILSNAEYIYKSQPREQALCSIAMLYPMCATEIALVCKKK